MQTNIIKMTEIFHSALLLGETVGSRVKTISIKQKLCKHYESGGMCSSAAIRLLFPSGGRYLGTN